jgi:pyruvate dehydrogenase E1 component
VNLDQHVSQLPDTDPGETEEWLDSLDAVVDSRGKPRARYLVSRLTERARELQVGTPAEVSTPYVNTIPVTEQPWFPGDEYVEKRLRRILRWNAAVMVINANKHADGIGGHLSSWASSAMLYEVGFNHFFRGKEDGLAGDHVYFQGHAAPGIYARAYLERRLDESQLDNFRREIGVDGRGLSSYPHPWLMPDFWEYPTVSMGLGPINSIYQARFNKYLHNRRIDDTHESRVWCFLGDGETDEPETLHLAGRSRGPRQPHLGDQLQPAAPGRTGAWQRQDHPGARVRVPWRRLERRQGDLGCRLGRAARSRRRRRAPRQDERHRGR